VECPDGREVTELWRVGSFVNGEFGDELRDQEVEIRITLTVTVTGEVHPNPVDVDRQVRSVVDVEAAQEVLIRLASSGVLNGDQTGRRFDEIAGAPSRTALQLSTGEHFF